MAEFLPGIELNRAFYDEVVAPIVAAWPHAAALLGWGSEILGFDTARSTDHGWGPRLRVFVAPGVVDAVRAELAPACPTSSGAGRSGTAGTRSRRSTGWRSTPWCLVGRHLGLDATHGMATLDWLLAPQQQLLGVTRGAVYHDHDGALGAVHARLAYFPDRCGGGSWPASGSASAQEEAFVGRTAEVGDELGRAARRHPPGARADAPVVPPGAREYWPYPKWFGPRSQRLPGRGRWRRCSPRCSTRGAATTREAALVAAYEAVARRHNEVGVSEPVDPTVRGFHDRGYRVLMAERFVAAMPEAARRRAPGRLPLVGSSTR